MNFNCHKSILVLCVIKICIEGTCSKIENVKDFFFLSISISLILSILHVSFVGFFVLLVTLLYKADL